jgi:hypothetical protein
MFTANYDGKRTGTSKKGRNQILNRLTIYSYKTHAPRNFSDTFNPTLYQRQTVVLRELPVVHIFMYMY